MIIPGKVTSAGTATYARQHIKYSFNVLNGWQVSQVGFSGCRFQLDKPAHREGLQLALLSGINLIDAGSDGRAHSLISLILAKLIATGDLAREQVVLIGQVDLSAPDKLPEQIDALRTSLGVETIDICLLNGTEQFLQEAHKENQPLAGARAAFYGHLGAAFQQLETVVSQGHIQGYGLSSETLAGRDMDDDFISLTAVLKTAQAVSAAHHFYAIKLPMNLFEPETAVIPNQANGQTTLAFAQEQGIAVLVSRPLNAYRNEHLIRLVDVPMPIYPATTREVSTAVDTLIAEEVRFQHEILPQLHLDEGTARELLEYLAIGRLLLGQWRTFATYHNWRDLQGQYLLPRAQTAVNFLQTLDQPPETLSDWLGTYGEAVNITFAAVSAFYQEESYHRATLIQEMTARIAPDFMGGTTSQTAVRALRATSSITSILVGMHQPVYVQDVLVGLDQPVQAKDRADEWAALRIEVMRET